MVTSTEQIEMLRTTLTLNRRDTLRNLVLFLQIKEREKHVWRSIIFHIVSGFLDECFSRIKLHKWYQITQSIIYESFPKS